MIGESISLNNTQELLHEKFNPRSDQIPPVRIKRFKRNDLADLFCELGFVVGAEIGVAEGYFSREICKRNPGVGRPGVWPPPGR